MKKCALLLMLAVILFAGNALACSCAIPTGAQAEEYMKNAGMIFIGEVTKIEGNSKTALRQTPANRKIHFRADKAWKGVNEETITITAWAEDGLSCNGYPFEIGKRYLVISDGQNAKVDSFCSPTKLLSAATNDNEKYYAQNADELLSKLGSPAILFEHKE